MYVIRSSHTEELLAEEGYDKARRISDSDMFFCTSLGETDKNVTVLADKLPDITVKNRLVSRLNDNTDGLMPFIAEYMVSGRDGKAVMDKAVRLITGATLAELVEESLLTKEPKLFGTPQLFESDIEARIKRAETYISDNGRLEIDYYDDNSGLEPGWYAGCYNSGIGVMLINDSRIGLIASDRELIANGIDIHAVFDRCGVRYRDDQTEYIQETEKQQDVER